jgi:hypothetical protein
MTVRNARQIAIDRERERNAEGGLDSETAAERLLRESPSQEELTPEMFLEDPNAIDAGVSQAGQVRPETGYTDDALDLLMQQVRQDQSGEVGLGQHAQMTLADSAHAGQLRGERQSAEAQAQAAGVGGSGIDIQAQMSGMGDANDALMNNYTSVFNNSQDQALNSLTGLGGEASGLRGESFTQDYRRGAAVDAFNAHNLGYQREVEGRNTDRRTAQSAAEQGAEQQVENNEHGLYSSMSGVRNANADVAMAEDQAEKDSRLAGFYAVTGAIT